MQLWKYYYFMFEAMKGLGHLEWRLLVCGAFYCYYNVGKVVCNTHCSLYFCTLLAPKDVYKDGNNFKIIYA